MSLSISSNVYVFDLEADNLLEEATKIHCLSIGKVTKSGEVKIFTTTDYDEMREFFLNKEITKVGHNIIRYDALIAEKILDIKVPTSNFIDTLPISWYLYPNNVKHGLEHYGELIGNSKIKINDWQNLPEDSYIERCEVDVQINAELWKMQKEYLLEIYRTEEAVIAYIKYSNFKSICVREQEQTGIRFDIERAQSTVYKLQTEKDEKISALAKVIPPEDITGTKTIPKQMYKKDGSMTSKWQEWLEFKRQYGVPDDWIDPIVYVRGSKEGNPNSPVQIKNWLFGLGWEPCTYSYTRNKETGEIKKVPQVYNKETGEITNSVAQLLEKEPGIEVLNGLGKLKHRIGLLEGLIKASVQQPDGTYRIYASMSGYTNTLRLQHKTIVNLPKVGIYMGEEIRGCFIADKGDVLCGSDLSNIESVTRNHYIKPLDPEYVATMERADFDAHIDIAVLANMMNKEDAEWYVDITHKIDAGTYEATDEEKERLKPLKKIRGAAKVANFSCTYGVGASTLSRNVGMKEREARKLIDTYWQRNWSIREFADSCKVKEVNGQRWIQNPVSKLWLSLRSDKDKFSTVNQSTAVYVFDNFLGFIRKFGVKVQYQCHDELLFSLPDTEDSKKDIRNMVNQSMAFVNELLKLNVTVSCSMSFAFRYSDCH